MKDDREKVLARIAEALTVAAPRHHETPMLGGKPAPIPPFRAWLPPVGPDLEKQQTLFAAQCAGLKTEFVECADEAAAAAHIAMLAEANDWKKLAFHPGALNDAIVPHLPESLGLFRVEAGYDKVALETCDAGLTECESLVAQTGSICVTALSSGGRALSVLPHHHVAVARRDQLLPDLTAAYERLAAKYDGCYPSFISFISGPSRTGDIERILVLGAHGPKKLTVLLLP
ncbi:MAG: LUD domain-containing protein [Verrucomicrobiota bacterium]